MRCREAQGGHLCRRLAAQGRDLLDQQAGVGELGGGEVPQPVADRERTQAIREWARAHGHKVSERGRLSAVVVEAYEAAH